MTKKLLLIALCSVACMSLVVDISTAADVTVPGGGTITGSSTLAGYSPTNAFDDEITADGRWLASTTNLPNVWIQYQFDNGEKYIVTNLVIYAGYYGTSYQDGFPKNFKLQGSNDGAEWTNVLAFTGAVAPTSTFQRFDFPVTNSVEYEYYKLEISAVQNDTAYVRVSELEFEGYAPPGPPYIGYADGPISSGPTGATLNGQIVSTNGAPLDAVRIYFGDNDGGTNAPTSWDTNFVFTSLNQGETFSTNVTGLFYGKTYYYAAYASNTYGETWLSITNFTTTDLWTPAQLNIEAWFDAADEYTLWDATTGGARSTSSVARWDDKSGNGHSLTQGIAGLQPTTGATIGTLNALSFRTNVLESTSLGSVFNGDDKPYYIYLIFEYDSRQATSAVWSMDSTSHTSMLNFFGTTSGGSPFRRMRRDDGNTATDNNYAFADDNPHISANTFDGSVCVDYMDGDEKLRSASNIGQQSVTHFILGGLLSASLPMTGPIGEVVIATSMTPENHERIEGYLAWKWGVKGDLVPGHAYESAAPVLALSVTNLYATNVTASTAELVCVLDATQSVFTVYAYWSTSNNTDSAEWLADNTASNALVGIYTNVVGLSLTNAVSNLLSSTTYTYTFMVTNDATNIWASSESFTTEAGTGDVVINNAAADTITSTSARLNAVLQIPGTNAAVIAYWWITGDAITNNSGVFGSWTNVASSNISYTVSGALQPDREYSVTFRATNATDDVWASPATNFITHLTSASRPVFTNVTSLPSGEIRLEWQDNLTETGYILQRSTSQGSGYSTIASPDADTTTYTDSGLSFSTVYYYQLSATNSENGSATAFSACRTNASVLATAVITNTVTLDVVADTYITEGYPTTNQNNDPEDELIVGWSPNSNFQRALIRFNTAGISVLGADIITVSNVVLKVTNRNTFGSGDPDIGVYEYAYNFGETTATWNNPAGNGDDSTPGGTIGTLLTSAANLDDSANVPHTFATSTAFESVVQTAIAGGSTINLLVKRPDDTGTSNDYIRFRDRDYGSGYFQLEVTYTMELHTISATVFRFR